MSIIIVRHGESVLNAARVFQHPETPLSQRGLAQAEKVGARLKDFGVTRIIASHYQRAASTAEAIARHTGAPLEIHEVLHERNYGDLRGLSHDDVDGNPHAEDFDPPGGESWPEFRVRVAEAWTLVTNIARKTHGNLAVVTHGLVCAALLDRHLGTNTDAEVPPSWPNTAVTIVDHVDPWTVQLAGCGAHLDTADVADSGQLSGI